MNEYIENTLKESKEKVFVRGASLERIKDLDEVPSPYLTGALDKFFNLPLVPMVETTRGCPFSCTFCSDGAVIKNKVSRYDPQRIKEELKHLK